MTLIRPAPRGIVTGIALVLASLLTIAVALEVALFVREAYLEAGEAAPKAPEGASAFLPKLHRAYPEKPYRYGLNPEHPDVNAYGLSSPEIAVPKPPGRLRILLLGDSVTFGARVSREDTFAADLERALRETRGPVDVLNAGVHAYTPFNELHFLLEEGKALEPDVVLVAFCMNDVANPRLHWNNASVPDDAIPNAEYDRVKVRPRLGRNPFGTWPPRGWSRLYQAIHWRVNIIVSKRELHLPDFDANPPTYITGEDDLGIQVLLDRDSPEWRWLADQYDQMAAEARRIGARFGVLLLPLGYQLDPDYPFFPQEQFLEFCDERGFACYDVLDAFQGMDDDDVFLRDGGRYFDIWHLSEHGHAVAARGIQSFLESGLLTPRP